MSDDKDFIVISERHAQIMKEGSRFFASLAIVITFGVVSICGLVIFLIFTHPFWRYP